MSVIKLFEHRQTAIPESIEGNSLFNITNTINPFTPHLTP
jgi:hypothetical protein